MEFRSTFLPAPHNKSDATKFLFIFEYKIKGISFKNNKRAEGGPARPWKKSKKVRNNNTGIYNALSLFVLTSGQKRRKSLTTVMNGT